jgi:hypothetical protein
MDTTREEKTRQAKNNMAENSYKRPGRYGPYMGNSASSSPRQRWLEKSHYGLMFQWG